MAIALSDNTDSNRTDASTSNTNTARISSENNNNNNNNNKTTSSTPTKSTCEMMGACTVCSDDQGTEENPLVYCDGCEVGVHQACYGIVSVPAGNWFCRRCEVGDSQGKIKCELCPSLGGALKQTKNGKWAHVVCALYIPEVRFGNNNTMEPIEIEHIHIDRFNKNCYLCEEQGNSTKATYGAVMNCHKLGCKQSFHVTCAQAANLLCEEARPSSPDNVNYCGYCKHHFRKLKAGNTKSGNSGANNSSSPYLDSASDSSQDNDSRCNERTVQDKNSSRNNNKLPGPSNIDSSETNSIKITPSVPVATTSTSLLETPSKDPLASTNKFVSTNSVNKPSSNLASPNATQRKKKTTTKDRESSVISSGSGVSAIQSNSSSTSLADTSSSTNETSKLQSTATSLRIDPASDPYNWSDPKEPNNKNSASNNNNKPAKKKATSSEAANLQIKATTKQPNAVPTSNSNSINISLQKVSSPNLSIATSPSLASPSNSTRSTSSSSTSSVSTTSAPPSSSSSSTVSNSPSPALASPNVSNKAPTRIESPLASGSRTGISTNNRLASDLVAQVPHPPVGQAHLQTKINLDDPRSDLKKVGSSLLSTVLPVTQDHNSHPTTSAPVQPDFTRVQQPCNYLPDAPLPNKEASTNPAIATSNNNVTSSNAQPLVPPLIIPAPQASSNSESSAPKTSTAKSSRASAKTPRKKSTDVNESTQKSEPKTKLSRSRKANSSVVDNPIPDAGSRQESKRAAKNKSATKLSDTAQASLVGAGVSPSKNQSPPDAAPSKRKSRSASSESNLQGSAAKKPRRRKADTKTSEIAQSATSKTSQGVLKNPLPPVTLMSTSINSAAPLTINTPLTSRFSTPSIGSYDGHDVNNRFLSPMISPYTNLDPSSAPSLSRSSLSRLFTSTALPDSGSNHQSNLSDDIGKAFEELRDNTWSHLSKSILEQAQQFDIPSLIGTLYTLRSENEKLINKVRDLTMKRDQLVAINARLDLPGPLLTQHLNQTSPNFTSVAASLGTSPKASPSPGAAMAKPPLVVPYNHLSHSSLGAPNYLDRSSPLINQAHPGLNSLKPSSMSTPSPPISALMAHSAGSRSGLTVNQPYMSNVFPPTNTLNPLGPAPGSSYYPRQ